jgi:hypothetical protein
LPRVPALVVVVRIVEWLVHIAGEVNGEFQRLSLGRPIRLRVFEDGRKLFRLHNDAITVQTLSRQVNS